MRKLQRMMMLFLVMLMALLVPCHRVSAAAEAKKDGLEVSMDTDRDSYQSNQQVDVTITVKNHNGHEVRDVSAEISIPRGWKVRDKNSNAATQQQLGAGQQMIHTVPLVRATSPSTGDNENTWHWGALIFCMGIALLGIRRIGKKRFVSFLLTLALFTGMLAGAGAGHVLAAEGTGEIEISKTVKMNEEDFTIHGKVSYGKEISGGAETYTRGEWISLLLDKLGISKIDIYDDYICYYQDSMDSVYGSVAETAWGWGILPQPEDSNVSLFEAEKTVTREYAAYTVYHGMGFSGDYRYSFSDAASISCLNEASLMIQQGFLDAQNGAFAPQQPLTEAEKNQIFQVMDSFGQALDFDSEKSVYDIDYVDDVRELTETDYTLTENTDGSYTVTIPSDSHLRPGDKFVLPSNAANPMEIALKVTEAVTEDGKMILQCVVPDMDEVLDEYNIAGYGTPNLSLIEAADGVEVEYGTGDISASEDGEPAAYNIEGSTPDMGKLKFKIKSDDFPLSGAFEMKIPTVAVKVQGKGLDIQEFSWQLKNQTKVQIQLGTKVEMEPDGSVQPDNPVNENLKVDGAKLYLLKKDIPIQICPGVAVGIRPYLYADASGNISLSYTVGQIVGQQYRNGALRFINDCSMQSLEKPTVGASASMKAGAGLNVAIKLFAWSLLGIDTTIGAALDLKYTWHTDMEPNLHCLGAAAYLFLDLGTDKESLIGGILKKMMYSWSISIFKETNSPFRSFWHVENGVKVPKCTYGKGHLAGIVVDEDTGAAIENAKVDVYNKATGNLVATVYTRTGETADGEVKQGEFLVKDLFAGVYYLEVTADNYRGTCVDVTVEKDARNEYTIRLKANGSGGSGEVTEEEIAAEKARNEAYRKAMKAGNQDDGYDIMGWGEDVKYFGTVDVNGDGVEELVIGWNNPENGDPKGLVRWDGTKLCAVSWPEYLGYMYYCKETGYVLLFGDGDCGFGYTGARVLNSKSWDSVCVYNVNYEYDAESGDAVWDGTYSELIEVKETYWDGEYNGSGVDYEWIFKDYTTPEEVAAFEARLDSYFPTQTLITAPYETIQENLDKYLPIDENTIRIMLEARQ